MKQYSSLQHFLDNFLAALLIIAIVLSNPSTVAAVRDFVDEESGTVNHTALVRNWIPLASIRLVNQAEVIYSQRQISIFGVDEMAVTQVLGPTKGILLFMGQGLIGTVEDRLAEEVGELRKAKLSGDDELVYAQREKIDQVILAANVAALAGSVPILLLFGNVGRMLNFLGHDTIIGDRIDGYVAYIAPCVPLSYSAYIYENYAIMTSHTRLAFAVSSITFSTLMTSWLFMRGPLKFENPFKGMALSASIESVLAVIFYYTYFKNQKGSSRTDLLNARFDPYEVWKIVKSGLPIVAKNFFLRLSPIILKYVIYPKENFIFATEALFHQIFFANYVVNNSIGKTVRLMMQKSASNPEAKYKWAILGVAQFTAITAAVPIAIWCFPHSFAGFYIDVDDLANSALIGNYYNVLSLRLLDHFVYNMGLIFTDVLIGQGHRQLTTYSTMAATWLRIPIGYLMTRSDNVGRGVVLASLIVSTSYTVFLQYHLWKEGFLSYTLNALKGWVMGTGQRPGVVSRIKCWVGSLLRRTSPKEE